MQLFFFKWAPKFAYYHGKNLGLQESRGTIEAKKGAPIGLGPNWCTVHYLEQGHSSLLLLLFISAISIVYQLLVL